MKRKPRREIKKLICNGFIYILVKGRCDKQRGPEPHFMGYQNWALQQIVKMRRAKPSKRNENE